MSALIPENGPAPSPHRKPKTENRKLFIGPATITALEPVKNGQGEGVFAVIAGGKPFQARFRLI